MALGPVVTGAGLAKDKVVWAEELAKGSGTNTVHGTWFKVHKDGTRHVTSASRLVEVNVDALELKVRVTVVGSGRIDAMLIRHDLPELGANLVAALASLDVNDLPHFV